MLSAQGSLPLGRVGHVALKVARKLPEPNLQTRQLSQRGGCCFGFRSLLPELFPNLRHTVDPAGMAVLSPKPQACAVLCVTEMSRSHLSA